MSIPLPPQAAPAALITGGARRVGAALALALAQDGYDIALHYHTSAKEAEAVQEQVIKLGRRCLLFPQDLRNIAALVDLVRAVKQAFPHLHALINSASIFERGGLMESTEAVFDDHFTINCKSAVFLSQGFARQVEAGVIINLLDTNIRGYGISHFFYLMSKKALADFTRMAAVELAPNIRVNAVCPGTVLPSNGHEAGYMEQLAQRLPLKHTANLDDVCNAVRWLVANPAITGQFIYTDGGQHLL